MSLHYLVKNNSFDAASRIVDHTHTTHQLDLVRATQVLLKKTIINSVN